MEYKYERKGTNAEIEIKNEGGVILFRLSSTPTNPMMLGDVVTDEMIEAENERAVSHAVLLEKFNDELELKRFCELISENPNNGYSNYLESIKINDILNQVK